MPTRVIGLALLAMLLTIVAFIGCLDVQWHTRGSGEARTVFGSQGGRSDSMAVPVCSYVMDDPSSAVGRVERGLGDPLLAWPDVARRRPRAAGAAADREDHRPIAVADVAHRHR